MRNRFSLNHRYFAITSCVVGDSNRCPQRLTLCRSSELSQKHYENTPMQYLAIFHGRKNDNFQMKNCDNFLIFAQNIDCGYTLEPPHRTASMRRF